jgi:serine/threonine protein kinase
MNLASGGSVGRFLAHHPELTEAATAAIVRKMLLAVRYCHEQHVCHRDIKVRSPHMRRRAAAVRRRVAPVSTGVSVVPPAIRRSD